MHLFAEDSLSIINQQGIELKGEEERDKQERNFLERKQYYIIKQKYP